MDGGWLPHRDEALDESVGMNEAVFYHIIIGGGFAPLFSKVQTNTQPQLSQLIYPKPHPNGKGPRDDFVHHWDDSSQSSQLHYRPAGGPDEGGNCRFFCRP